MRIAVTGAAGRVGGHVVELASSLGHSVVAIDWRPLSSSIDVARYADVDTMDYERLAEVISDCDALIHLAAITGPGRDPDHVVHNTNVVSSYNALRAASQVGIQRVCQASSINAI